MTEKEKLGHLQAMLQITEYIDCIARYNKDVTIDDFYAQPLPEIDTQEPTLQSIEDRLKRIINQPQQVNEVSVNPTSSVAQSIMIKEEKKSQSTRKPQQQQQPTQAPEKAKDYTKQNQLPENLRELTKIIQSVSNQMNMEQFVNYPCDKLFPNYSAFIQFPFSLNLIYIRLNSNISEQCVPQIYDTSDKNIMIQFQDSDYEVATNYFKNNYSIDLYDRIFRDYRNDQFSMAEKCCSKYFKQQLPPYQYITEIVRDFLLIAINCWYFNYQNQELVKFSISLIQNIYKKFTESYSIEVWPKFAQFPAQDVMHIKNNPQNLELIKSILSEQKQFKSGGMNYQQQSTQQIYSRDQLINMLQQAYEKLGNDKYEGKIFDITNGEELNNLCINQLEQLKKELKI